MTADYGKPPASGWAPLVPELLVTDFDSSLAFWTGLVGFTIAYQRPEEKFAFLERHEGAQIMLSQRSGVWETGPLEAPFGRGVMFQIFADSIQPVAAALLATRWPLETGPRDVWRRYGDREGGKREIVFLDPDGYLVMVAESLGERALPHGPA